MYNIIISILDLGNYLLLIPVSIGLIWGLIAEQKKSTKRKNELTPSIQTDKVFKNTSTKKCPECSVDVSVGDNFCMKCGFDFNNTKSE